MTRKFPVLFAVSCLSFVGLAAFRYFSGFELDTAARSSYRSLGFPVEFLAHYPDRVVVHWHWLLLDVAVILLFSYKISSLLCRKKVL